MIAEAQVFGTGIEIGDALAERAGQGLAAADADET